MSYKPNINFKTNFDTEAELYNDWRPGLPDELFDRIVEMADLNEDASLLEIGPGTGKTTKPMAERGYKITAIELGTNLAKMARKHLQGYPNVDVIGASFEDINLSPNSYDLIYCASAFHWIKPEVKYTKTHSLLKPGGYLALMWGRGGISDENGDSLYYAMKPFHDKYFQETNYSEIGPPKKVSELGPPDDIDESLFEVVHFEAFPREIQYTTEEFVKHMGTYSRCIHLDHETREEYFEELRKLVDEEFNGVVKRRFGNVLTILKAR